jgi:hypothetical protein
MFTGFNLGSALVGFGAAMILGDYGWRMVLVAGGVIPAGLHPACTWFLIPESVRFMVVNNYPADRWPVPCAASSAATTSRPRPASPSANRKSRARPRPRPC